MFIVFKPDGSYHTEETGPTAANACKEGDVLFSGISNTWYMRSLIGGYQNMPSWRLVHPSMIDKQLQLAAILIC